MPVISPLSQSEIEAEDGTVKYNLTDKSLVGPSSNVPHCGPVLSESRLQVMEERERLRLKLRKKEKAEKLAKQKINKLMFFFFTL